MTFWGITRFELGYQLGRPWPWLMFGALAAFSFFFTGDGSLAEAQYDDFFLNSPYVLAGAAVFGSVIWLLIGASVAGEAAARDVATGMHPLVYTAPIRRIDYLGGRFVAALGVNALILLAVPLGNVLAVLAPGVDASVVGPFWPAAYLTAFAYIALPNAFVATAIQFSLAARSGRPMASYLGSLLVFFMAFFLASVFFYGLPWGDLLDPVGLHFIIEDLTVSWTRVEKSTRLIALEGTVLWNRLFWTGVGLVVLGVTWARFRFVHAASGTRRVWRSSQGSPASTDAELRPGNLGWIAEVSAALPRVRRGFGWAQRARQTLAIGWVSFRSIAGSWAGLIFLGFIPLLALPVVLDQMSLNGVSLVPTTALVLGELTAPLGALSRWMIVPLFLVLFAGELVWRERDAGIDEITGATPVSGWSLLLGKALGLVAVLVMFLLLLATAGVAAQAIRGYDGIDIGLYGVVLLGLQLPEYVLFGVLALVVHVLVDQKYVGHLVGIGAYVFILMPSMFGADHALVVYGAGPSWAYSEMRGFGSSVTPWLWLKAYWAAWAILLLLAAGLFWVRGREESRRARVHEARRRLTPATAGAVVAAVALVALLGGSISREAHFSDASERRAEYERRYGAWADAHQPVLAAADLHVEIHPGRGALEVRGTYRLVNPGPGPIDTLHLATPPVGRTTDVGFDRAATAVVSDSDLHHRIYGLLRPLQSGDTLHLRFRVEVEQDGLQGGGAEAVASNGTYFTQAWLPAVGYQSSRELAAPTERRAHGLPERPVVPPLEGFRHEGARGNGVVLSTVLSTDPGQVAVAPGALHRSWTEGGRSWFEYRTSGPIGTEWAFLSADYAVHETEMEGVAVRFLHHPAHVGNREDMVESVRTTLNYYAHRFGAYPYDHLTLAEQPGNGVGLHAEPSMVTFSEGFALLDPAPGGLDLPFATVAHEMAHQWTVPYAFVEGAPVMSEGIAWYYAMEAVEHGKGPDELRRLLAFMRMPNPYPPIRRGEPLVRGLDPYLAYRKGPFALRALSEYVGEEPIHRALRRLLETHRPAEAPLATTLDLLREIRAVTPDTLLPLVHDLFEVNTFWEMEAQRATAVPTPSGSWEVTLDLRARKVVVDSAGVEREVLLDDPIEIGVFGSGGRSEPLYLQRHRLASGEQRLILTVPEQPLLAGVDPNRILDWEQRGGDDNVTEVVVAGAAGGDVP